jgi:redox-sensitive bicupin YhaK (pirin superfamily)
MQIEILHRDSLPLGGFAGLKEHRLVVDKRVNGDGRSCDGLGNFVYLADASFLPKGETRLHSHKEIDVISVMVEGRIAHEGSLEHGKGMEANQVQVQRAGGEGFSHNEVNPDPKSNRMIQLWVLPETPGERAGYKSYILKQGTVTKIYGGYKEQDETFDSRTTLKVGMLNKDQNISQHGEFLAYITKGSGQINGESVKDGDLVRGVDLECIPNENMQIIIITHEV